MKNTFFKLIKILMSIGYSKEDAQALLFKLLDEEAYDFICTTKSIPLNDKI